MLDSMPDNDDEIEEKVRKLCWTAKTERDPVKLRVALIQLREFLHQHHELLRSMTDETFEALWKLRH